MKGLLEKLMARQARLVSKLSSEESPADRESLSNATAGAIEHERAVLSRVDALLVEGDVEQARQLLEPLESTASLPRTLTVLARVSALLGDQDRALERLLAAERVDAMDRATWRLLADQMLRMGKYEAELTYRRKLALSDSPPSAASLVALIKALVRASHGWRHSAKTELRSTVERLKHAADSRPEHFAEAAEALYAGASLVDDARRLYQEAMPCPPTHLDVTAKWTPMMQWCAQHSVEILRDPSIGQPGRRAEAAELPEVLVSPMLRWTPLLEGGGVLLAGFEKATLPTHLTREASPLLLNSTAIADLRLPRIRVREPGPALLLGGSPDKFRHQVDYLGALAVAETLGVAADLPVVVDATLTAWQVQLLTSLGVSEDRLIKVSADQVVQFDRLLVPTRLSSAGTWVDPALPAWFRRRLATAPGPESTPRKLYLRSGSDPRHQIHNDAEVSAGLARLGFVTLDVDAAPLLDWRTALSHATHVAAPLGPAFADTMLCPPGAILLAFCDRAPDPAEVQRQRALAAACGHRLQLIACARSVEPDGAEAATGLVVDPSALTAALTSAAHAA